MFCPICKAEYRLGYTKCADCGVDLVEHLSDHIGAPVRPAGDPEEMEVLWAGVDARLSSSITSALDAAQIAYKENSVESQLMPAFRQSIYRIEVRRGDYEAAVECLQGLTGSDLINPKSPSALLDRNSSVLSFLGINRSPFVHGPIGEPSPTGTVADESEAAAIAESESDEENSGADGVPDDLVEDFFPEEATREVWSGEDSELAENIPICLRGVGIGCEVREENGKSRILVMPQAEARAREIIREVVEASPPQ